MADKEVRVRIIGDTSDLKKKLSDLKKELKDVANGVGNNNNNAFDKLSKDANKLKENLNDTDKAVDNLNDSLKQTNKNSNFDSLNKSASKLGTSMTELGKKIKDTFSNLNLGDKLKNSFTGITDGIQSRFTKLGSKIKDIFSDLGSSFKKVFSNLGNGFDISSITKKFTSIKDSMKELGSSVLNKVATKFKDIFSSGQDGTTIFGRLKNIISSITGKIGDFGGKIKGVFSKGKSGILDMVTAFNSWRTATNTGDSDLDKYKKRLSSLIEYQKKWTKEVEDTEKEISKLVSQINKSTKSTGDTKKDYRSKTANLYNSEEIDKLNKKLETNKKRLEAVNGEIEKTKNKINGLDTSKLSEAFASLKDAFGKFKSGDIKGAFDVIKNGLSSVTGLSAGTISAIAGVTTAVVALTLGFNKLYQASKQNFFQNLENIKSKLQPIVDIAKRIGTELKQAFENITGTRLDLSSAIEQAVEFESTMAQVSAIAGANDKELITLTNTARKWGATTRYSANQVGEAMVYTSMAGWSAQETMAGLEGILNLATAGCIDLGQASDFVTDGLEALGMSASQSNDFVDMLSATITKSNTGVSQMQGAFENVAPIAGTLNVSMSDLSVALGLMANQGVKAEKAGTALKNLLTNMSSPTESMTKAIEKYNLQGAQKLITDGKLIDGIKEMKTRLEGLTASEKTSVITTIAGREALSGVSALLNSSTNDINSLKFAVDSSTKSSRAYAMSLGLIDEKTGEVKVDINNLTKEQQKAYDQWQNFNSIMEETTDTMTLVGGTTTDLGAIIARFGKDASSDKVNNVLDFFDKMENSSDKATKTMKKYGIELKKNEDGSINFGETLKDVAVKWDDLTDAQKKSLAEQLGFKGSIKDLNELFGNEGDKIEELVDVYKEMEGVSEHLAKSFDATLKGSILSLSSAIQERLLQVFDKIKPAIQGVVDTLKTFFDIWNGMSEKVEGSGFGKAIEWLAEQSKGWGEAIANGLSNAISSIDKFINGKSFDNILKIGTNIIQGICKGIDKSYKDGSLTRAIDGAIKKICKFVKDNAPAVEKAGKQIIDSIKTGIKNNQDNINSALDGIMGVINTWAQGSAELDSLCGTFASNLIDGFIEQIGIKAKGKATEFWNAVKNMFDITNVEFPPNTAGDVIDKLFGFNEESKPPETTLGKIGKWIKDYFCGESFADEVDKAGQNTTNNLNKGMEKGKEGTKSVADSIGQLFGQSMVSAVQQAKGQLQTEFTAIQNSARTAFTGMANIVRNQFLNCTNIVRNQAVNMTNIVRNQALNMSNIFRNQFVNCTNIIRNQMVNCANIVRNQCVNMANIFRNQFISMRNVARNQMVNVSNIVRNQAISWSNVIRNQVTNARNSFTQQFMSMRSVARNQLVAISNIVRNQAVAWANIIRNQSANCRSAMTSNFNGLASVARAGMSNVLATVRSYMAQIRSAVSQQMTMNFKVNKTVTTTNVTKNVQEGMRSTMSAMNSNMMGVGSPNIMSASGLGTININTNNGGISGNLALEVPLYLDGREVARATASYTQDELAKLSKRKNRKRGE